MSFSIKWHHFSQVVMFTLQLFFFNSICFTLLFLGIFFFSCNSERGKSLFIEQLGTAQTSLPYFSLLLAPSTSCVNLELYFCQADTVVFSKWWDAHLNLVIGICGSTCCTVRVGGRSPGKIHIALLGAGATFVKCRGVFFSIAGGGKVGGL